MQDPLYTVSWDGGAYGRHRRMTTAELRDLSHEERRELDRTGTVVLDDGSEVVSW